MFRPINIDADETTVSPTETRNCNHSMYNCLNNGHKSTSASQHYTNAPSRATGRNSQSVTSPPDDVTFRRFSTSRCHWQPREAVPLSNRSALVPSVSSAFTTPNRKHLEYQSVTSQQTESRGDEDERRRGRVKRIAQCFDHTQTDSKQQQQQQQQQAACGAVKQSSRQQTTRHTVFVQQLTNTANCVPVVRVVSAPVHSRASVPVVPSVVPCSVVPTSTSSTSRRRPQIPDICLQPTSHSVPQPTNTQQQLLVCTPVTALVSLPAARRTSFYKSLEHLPLTSLTPRDCDVIARDGKRRSDMTSSTVDETLKHKSVSTQFIASRDQQQQQQQQTTHRQLSAVGSVRPMLQTVDCLIKLRPPDTDLPRDVSRDVTRTVTIKSGRVLQGPRYDVIANRALPDDISNNVVDRNRWIEDWLNRQDKPRGAGRTDSAVGVVGSGNRKRQISEVRVSVNNAAPTTTNGLVQCNSLGGATTTSLSKVLVSPTFTRKHFDELLTSRPSDVTNSLPRDVDRRCYLSTSSLMTSSPSQTLNQTLIDIVRQSHLQAFPPTTTMSTSPTSWSTTLHSPQHISPTRLTSDVIQQSIMTTSRQVSESNGIQSVVQTTVDCYNVSNSSSPLQPTGRPTVNSHSSVPFQLVESVLDNRMSQCIVAGIATTASQSPTHTPQHITHDNRLTAVSVSMPLSPLHLLPLHDSSYNNSPAAQQQQQQQSHVSDVTPHSLEHQLVPSRSTSLLSRPSPVHHQGLPTSSTTYNPLPSTPLPQRAQVGYISVPQTPAAVPSRSIVPIQQTVPTMPVVPQPISKLLQQPSLPVVSPLPPVTSQISDSLFAVNGFVTSALDSAIARLSQHVNNDVTLTAQQQQQQQYLQRDNVLTSPLNIESSDSVSEFGYDLANDSMVDESRQQQTELMTSSVDVSSNGLRQEVEILQQLEALRQRRALQLCKDDSFNRPDTPTNIHNKHTLPLPRDSVILRHRRHRQMTSSSTSSSTMSSESDSSSSSEDIYELTTRRTVRRKDRHIHRHNRQDGHIQTDKQTHIHRQQSAAIQTAV